ncbi:hypothetical protein PFISCL1PPCAC_6576, partial [Pristionchus fissidentatus]
MAKIVQLNLISFTIQALSMYILGALSMVVPDLIGAHIRPFPCDDPSIWAPFIKPLISTTTLIIVTLLLPILAILASEFYNNRFRSSDIIYKCRKFQIPFFLVQTITYYGYLQLGYAMQVIVSQVTKYSVGR